MPLPCRTFAAAPAAILHWLREFESRNVTFIESDGSWPIVWERAKGVFVWDARGRRYLDLTAAFGVAAAGHANPNVVKAGQRQMGRLLHAMGDVHPHARKAELACELSSLTFGRWMAARGTQSSAKTIFCNSGFEAVEAAFKTALLATGKSGVIAFAGAYHGLGYGALNVTHRDFFRRPFHLQLRRFGHFVPYPKAREIYDLRPPLKRDRFTIYASHDRRMAARATGFPGRGIREPCHLVSYKALDEIESRIRRLLRSGRIGAILVEPIQARGGIIVPPQEYLPLLRYLCDEHGALLIADEIYTGFGRTGKWFACEHGGVVPDLICLGKALAGGFPLSACVGRADLMDTAWPQSRGEAIHTSTFLGHPVGCAMALAQIAEIDRAELCSRAAELGKFLLEALAGLRSSRFKLEARGLGLMAGLELNLPNGKPAGAATFEVIKQMLRRGYILLPEGAHGNVISFTPPLTIGKNQLAETVRTLAEVLHSGKFKTKH